MSDNKKIIFNAFAAVILLLLFYFSIVTAVSGWQFAKNQFSTFWYFLLGLSLGFGIQIGLYTYLRQKIKNRNAAISGKPLVITGTTSTLAMISCCAHYLANVLPILGITGALAIIAQYQIQLFWIGLLFNIFGIAYMANKIINLKKKS